MKPVLAPLRSIVNKLDPLAVNQLFCKALQFPRRTFTDRDNPLISIINNKPDFIDWKQVGSAIDVASKVDTYLKNELHVVLETLTRWSDGLAAHEFGAVCIYRYGLKFLEINNITKTTNRVLMVDIADFRKNCEIANKRRIRNVYILSGIVGGCLGLLLGMWSENKLTFRV